MRRLARFNEFLPFGQAFRYQTSTTSDALPPPGVGTDDTAATVDSPLVNVSDSSIQGVKIISLNNGKVNILTPQLLQQLLKTFNDVCGSGDGKEREACRGVIITSEQPGVFSSGLDLNVLHTNLKQDAFIHYWNQFQQLFIALHTLPVPLISAINGHAPAAGCIIALASDYRVMARKHPVNGSTLNIGIGASRAGFVVPPYVGQSLAYVVGQRRADVMLQQGRMCSAEEALRIGLVDALVDNVDETSVLALTEMERFLDMPGAHSYWLVKDQMRRSLLRSIATHELRVADCVSFYEMLNLPDVRKDMETYITGLSKKRKRPAGGGEKPSGSAGDEE